MATYKSIRRDLPADTQVTVSPQRLEQLVDKPCAFCGNTTPPSKRTWRNVGKHNFRAPYSEDNIFPLCELCFRIRKGRSRDELLAHARRVCTHLKRTIGARINTDIVRAAAAKNIKRALKQTPQQLARLNTPKTRLYIKNRYKSYSKTQRQRVKDGRNTTTCASSNQMIPWEMFSTLMLAEGEPCLYCGCTLRTNQSCTDPAVCSSKLNMTKACQLSLDRIDVQLCYTLDNVLLCCHACNVMRGSMPVMVFLKHLLSLAQQTLR
jgi:hypothetical protein